MDYTISESFTLPSLGKVYAQQFDPVVTLRSMTTNEEMKRLRPSERSLQVLAEMIDDCLVTKLPISSYDMSMNDFEFLLHKLRIVTYGDEYKVTSICPYCGEEATKSLSLDKFKVSAFSEDCLKYKEFNLPVTKKQITLKMQTPRIIDDNDMLTKQAKKNSSNSEDSAFLISLISMVDLVDGEKLDAVKLEQFLRSLPMADTNTIVQYSKKFNKSFGLDLNTELTCEMCGLAYTNSFRISQEFFGPSIDI